MRNPMVTGLSACAAILLLAGSCARDPSPQPGRSVTPLTQPPTQQPQPEQLDFEGEKIGGGTIRGSDYAGRDVVLWLWAPW
ncbi:MAG: hypothetical protein KY429_01560 [Actinobacteria bacterium]|nr:hypothetical protein [Actinomycetota bacterium]